MLHLCCFFMVTFLPCFSMESLPQDDVLPKLILHGVLTGCSFSRTPPTWVHTMDCIPSGKDYFKQEYEQQLLWDNLLLSMGCRSGLEHASCIGFPWASISLGHSYLFHHGLLHGLQSGYLIWHGSHCTNVFWTPAGLVLWPLPWGSLFLSCTVNLLPLMWLHLKILPIIVLMI